MFGHHDLAVIPQTSTIASHLPRALGVAFAIGRARRLGVASTWPADAIAVCSFGDASANHSTAQGAINAACYTAHSGLPVPLLFLCEDNGRGISVPTPSGWIEASFAGRPSLRYAQVDGTDPVGVHAVTRELADHVRASGRPALIHLRTVRYMGHAGTDVESGYRSIASIRADYRLDPILATARTLVESGARSPAELVDEYLTIREHVRKVALDLAREPTLLTATEVAGPLSPRRPDVVTATAVRRLDIDRRRDAFGGTLPESEGALTLAESINRALADVLVSEAGRDRVRGGRRPQGWRLRRDARAAEEVRRRPRVRLAARRAVDPRDRARRRRVRAAPDPGDPVPRLPAQRRGPAAGRGGEPVVLLQRPVPQPDGRAHRRARLPEGVRRPLPQRQRGRGAARHPRPRDRLAGAPVRRGADAAHVRGGGSRRRDGVRLPGADRALPHARPARDRRRCLDRAVRRRRRRGRTCTSRSGRGGSSAKATTC